MKITLVTLNYKDAEGCRKVCEQAKKIDIINHIVIVDNMSNDGSYEELCKLEDDKIKIVKSKKNGGYSYGYNYGLKIAESFHTDYVFICNSDIIFDKILIKKCIDFLENHDECGAVSARQKDVFGKECISAWEFPKYINDLKYCFSIYRKYFFQNKQKSNYEMIGTYQKVDAVSGCFTCFKMNALIEAGMYDENVFLYNEENIISRRLQKIGLDTYRLNDCAYIHNHKRKRGVSEINYKKILQIASSGYYYHVIYNNINIIQKLIFKTSMYIGAFETYLVNFVKKIANKK